MKPFLFLLAIEYLVPSHVLVSLRFHCLFSGLEGLRDIRLSNSDIETVGNPNPISDCQLQSRAH